MKKITLTFLAFFLLITFSFGQDSTTYKLKLTVPVLDFPQNASLPNYYPSMNQSLEWSRDLYELSFWGIDALGNKIFKPDQYPEKKWRTYSNHVFKYALGLGFSKYGSELPIPIGVWGHEEFHRTTLGVKNIASENGNWLLSRWDGTVYGVSDETLDELKANDLNQLLYSYTAGVQYEVLLNQKIAVDDFFSNRSLYKNALLLYNAHYVYNYFKFSTSAFSDSVKVIAPKYENADPSQRDFAGADLTAWVYDMYNPDLPFTSRDSFPNGEGVNRRVGFSDLSGDAQSFLLKQKKLSLLNFVNPAIFFVNKIRINENLAFNFFAQYAPTHFGNDVALYLPVRYKKFNMLVDVHNYSGRNESGLGIGLGLFNYSFTENLDMDFVLNYWNQPRSFNGSEKINGGSFQIKTDYVFNNNLSAYVGVTGKTEGWMMGNPYLKENISVEAGLKIDLLKSK